MSQSMVTPGKGSLADSPCSRNARPQKALVGRAQLRVSHVAPNFK